MSTAVSAGAVREALLTLPEGTSHGVLPSPSHVYLPPSHVKALNSDVQLVTGMRGAGKTSGGARCRTGRCGNWWASSSGCRR